MDFEFDLLLKKNCHIDRKIVFLLLYDKCYSVLTWEAFTLIHKTYLVPGSIPWMILIKNIEELV